MAKKFQDDQTTNTTLRTWCKYNLNRPCEAEPCFCSCLIKHTYFFAQGHYRWCFSHELWDTSNYFLMNDNRIFEELPSVVISGMRANNLVYFISEFLMKSWTIYQILPIWAILKIIWLIENFFKSSVVFEQKSVRKRNYFLEMAQTYCKLETRQPSSKSLFDTTSFDKSPINMDCISHPKKNGFNRMNSR